MELVKEIASQTSSLALELFFKCYPIKENSKRNFNLTVQDFASAVSLERKENSLALSGISNKN